MPRLFGWPGVQESVALQLVIREVNRRLKALNSDLEAGRIPTLDADGHLMVGDDLSLDGVLQSGRDDDTASSDSNRLARTTATTNALVNALILELFCTGTAAVGFGQSLGLKQDDAGGTTVTAGRIDTPWTTATAGAATADLVLSLLVANVVTEVVRWVGASLQANFAGSVNVASGKVYKVNGTQVVGAQQAANADTSGATLGQLETEVNELKAALRTHGLIAT